MNVRLMILICVSIFVYFSCSTSSNNIRYKQKDAKKDCFTIEEYKILAKDCGYVEKEFKNAKLEICNDKNKYRQDLTMFKANDKLVNLWSYSECLKDWELDSFYNVFKTPSDTQQKSMNKDRLEYIFYNADNETYSTCSITVFDGKIIENEYCILNEKISKL